MHEFSFCVCMKKSSVNQRLADVTRKTPCNSSSALKQKPQNETHKKPPQKHLRPAVNTEIKK